MDPSETLPVEQPCWYLYIIETRAGRLYTGITTDIRRRFEQHRQGKGAKFFRTDPPRVLRLQRLLGDRSAATKEECRVKKLTRIKKLEYIRQYDEEGGALCRGSREQDLRAPVPVRESPVP